MDVNKYTYLWENFENVLVKTRFGYSIVDKNNFTIIATENEKLESQIIEKMLLHGNPIYESIVDLKNNSSPINNVGQPSKAETFPVKRYKLSVQWKINISLVNQVKQLKAIFPIVKSRSNRELIDIAKRNEKWDFDVLYLDDNKKNEILLLAKKNNLNIIIEPDDLKGYF